MTTAAAPVPSVSMKALLEAGVHFGHQTHRWDPRMKPYIFTERNGIHIIDLQQTVPLLEQAMDFVARPRSRGETRPLRRHEEAGAGVDRGRSDALRHALRHQPLARRHAHQLPDHREPHRPPRPPRRPLRDRGEFERPDQEGSRQAHRRDREDEPLLRRHQEHAAACPARSSSSTRRWSASPSPKRSACASRSSPCATRTPTRTRSTTRSPANDDAIRAVKLIASKIADAVIEGRNLQGYAVRGRRHRRPRYGVVRAAGTLLGLAGRSEPAAGQLRRSRSRAPQHRRRALDASRLDTESSHYERKED